jgi:hypothetical protein
MKSLVGRQQWAGPSGSTNGQLSQSTSQFLNEYLKGTDNGAMKGDRNASCACLIF